MRCDHREKATSGEVGEREYDGQHRGRENSVIDEPTKW
jgi:hypothetical protein